MPPPDHAEMFVPGRLCLFGEHSDWAAEYGLHRGYCLIIGTDQGVSARARRCDRFVVESPVPDDLGRPSGRSRRMKCLWQDRALLTAARDEEEFFRYCAGVAHQMMSLSDVTGGLDLQITAMDLPLRKGVSSSAAVCILVAKAFDAVYQLNLFPHELMELAYLGERLTGSQCGRMDQACIYGKTPVLVTFERTNGCRVEPIFPGDEMAMFIVDLAGRKDTVKILADLQSEYLKSGRLQRALGPDNERIVRQAYQAVTAGDAPRLGELMTEAQAAFDESISPHCVDELASPRLHEVLNLPDLAEHVYGGKGVGSQGDGTAQFVARDSAARDAAMAIIEQRLPKMKCWPLTIPSHRESAGARGGAQ
ncbi:MAG: mevalonate kinase family protein [Planctomycetota bacterium]|jgi:galactokinase